MKVAHIYDDISKLVREATDPLDVGQEWEDAKTIKGQRQALLHMGYQVVAIPFDENLVTRLVAEQPDCVFNISEGKSGKDRESVVPAICKHLNIPCTSSDAVGMGLSLDKALCKSIARIHNVPTPDWYLIRDIAELDLLKFDSPEFNFPLFVKPNFEGSSMGIRNESLVHDFAQLKKMVSFVLENFGAALIEQAMLGFELTVGLLGNQNPQAFQVAEIKTGGKIYDKSMKGKDSMDEEIICPAKISKDLSDRLISQSKLLFLELGLSGLCRVDFKLQSDDFGVPMFLEINPLPGLSRYYSVFSIQAKQAGLSYDQMIGKIVELAFEKR